MIKTLDECVIKTLNGKIKISKKDKFKLNRFKYSLRKILSRKKKILIQEGGFLQYILPSAIALITTFIEKFLKQLNTHPSLW